MDTVYFVLKEPQGYGASKGNKTTAAKLKETPINVVARYKLGKVWKTFKTSTGYKVKPSNWNFDKQRIRSTAETGSTRAAVNSALDTYQIKLIEVFADLLNEGLAPNNNELKNRLLIKLGKKVETVQEQKVLDIASAQPYYLKDLKKRLAKNGKVLGSRTEFKYKKVKKILIEFEDETGVTNEFENIDLNWYDSFTDFLNEREYSLNSIGDFIKMIKALMNYATKKGWNKNLVFMQNDFAKPHEKAELPYLNESELLELNNADLSELPTTIAAARDWFLIGAYTGQRFGDWQQITPDRIEDGEYLTLTQSKGNKETVVWIRPEIFEIWERNGNTMPRLISNQKFNKAIKIACEKAQINNQYVRRITKGGESKIIALPKYEHIGSHCARRSFISNNIANSIDRHLIKSQSGHDSDRVFEGYNRLEQRKTAELYKEQYNAKKRSKIKRLG